MFDILVIFFPAIIFIKLLSELCKFKYSFFSYKSLIILFSSLFIDTFYFDSYVIKSDSMLPTFRKGALVFSIKKSVISSIGYSYNKIYIFKNPVDSNQIIAKRCVAFSGDIIKIINNHIIVNNKISNSYSSKYVINNNPIWPVIKQDIWTNTNYGPLIIPFNTSCLINKLNNLDNSIFLFFIGDNIFSSIDSRNFGPVPKINIISKVFLILDFHKFYSLLYYY